MIQWVKKKKLRGSDDDYDSFDVVEIISALCNDFFFIGNLIVSFQIFNIEKKLLDKQFVFQAADMFVTYLKNLSYFLSYRLYRN